MLTKAIITTAGIGTRMLPATKVIPKELLPLIDKPIIHYIAKQCLDAGITELIIVKRRNEDLIEKYFKKDKDLTNFLIKKNKAKIMQELDEIIDTIEFIFIDQDPSLPYGNAAPLYSVRKLISNEAFIYSWGDAFIFGNEAGIPELIASHKKNQADIILTCMEVPQERIQKHGIIELKNNSNKVKCIIEKPTQEKAPSNLASTTPYLLNENIFKYLDPKNVNEDQGEFLLQDAITELINDGGRVMAHVTKGIHQTNGDPLRLVQSVLDIALQRDDLREEVIKYIKSKL